MLVKAQPYEEKELLFRIANGDEKAFHIIYQHYFGRVYSIALGFLPNAMMAQDIVQEVFSSVWVNRDKLREVQKFEGWLVVVTRNLLIKSLRKIHPPQALPALADSADTMASLDYRELEALLGEAVGKLSRRQQQVYRLSRESGCSHKEIAGQLGISVDVSREYLGKALQSIRSFLTDRYGLTATLLSLLFFYV